MKPQNKEDILKLLQNDLFKMFCHSIWIKEFYLTWSFSIWKNEQDSDIDFYYETIMKKNLEDFDYKLLFHFLEKVFLNENNWLNGNIDLYFLHEFDNTKVYSDNLQTSLISKWIQII